MDDKQRSTRIPIWVWLLAGLGAIAGLAADGNAIDAVVGGVIWFGIGLFLAWLFRVLFRRKSRSPGRVPDATSEATDRSTAPPPPPPASGFCPHCGAAVTVVGATFCPACGRALSQRP
jgi:hypothetical protein